MSEPACLVPSGDWTGEAATWKADEQALYWVDIQRFLIHRYDPALRSTCSWLFDEPPTALGLTSRPDTLVVALASKVILWQPSNDARVDFARPEERADCRLNDGRPDPAGNFWVGSMQNNVAADGTSVKMTDTAAGSLYRITGNGRTHLERPYMGISNTLCWSPRGDTFYFGDSLKNEIWAYDYDLSTGNIANERTFFAGFDRGVPDGSAMDREGYLWNARYGGGCVVRVAPDGTIDGVLEMPVDNITTCTFGGHDLRTLFITTAKGGSGPKQRLAGSLFAVRTEAPGLPENVYTLAD